MRNQYSVNPGNDYILGAKVYSPCCGYEVLRKKKTQNKATPIKSSYPTHCIRDDGEMMNDGVWSDPAALSFPWTSFKISGSLSKITLQICRN